jgi:Flp pilus assembly protein TadD
MPSKRRSQLWTTALRGRIWAPSISPRGVTRRRNKNTVALEPNNLAHCENLIDALIKLDKPDQVQEASRAALVPARRLLEKTPRDARAHLRVATLCARTGDATTATAEATQSLTLEPDNVQILFRSAKVYGILNRQEQALDVLEKAVNLGLSKVEIVNDPDLEVLRDSPRYQRILVLAS